MNKPFLSSVILRKQDQQQKQRPSLVAAIRIGGGLDDEDPLEAFERQCNNKACHAVINFMYYLLACQYDQGITEVMQTKGVIKGVQWMEVDCLESLREIHRLLNLHKTVVETGLSGPPETGSRTLQRYASEVAEDPARK